MLKGQDIVLLLWLLGRAGPPPTFSAAAEALDLSQSAVHRSTKRLAEGGLIGPDHNVLVAQADELLSHGLRYLLPPVFGGETRGIPTAWATEPLKGHFAEVGPALVWPDPAGRERGIGLEPLHPVVPQVAARDPAMHERLALADALRLGDRRAHALARDELRKFYSAITP